MLTNFDNGLYAQPHKCPLIGFVGNSTVMQEFPSKKFHIINTQTNFFQIVSIYLHKKILVPHS